MRDPSATLRGLRTEHTAACVRAHKNASRPRSSAAARRRRVLLRDDASTMLPPPHPFASCPLARLGTPGAAGHRVGSTCTSPAPPLLRGAEMCQHLEACGAASTNTPMLPPAARWGVARGVIALACQAHPSAPVPTSPRTRAILTNLLVEASPGQPRRCFHQQSLVGASSGSRCMICCCLSNAQIDSSWERPPYSGHNPVALARGRGEGRVAIP